MGRMVDSASRSTTGLLGVPVGGQMTPGEMPQQDRDILVLDEAHRLDKDTSKKLKECSEKMEASKAEVVRQGIHKIHDDLKK